MLNIWLHKRDIPRSQHELVGFLLQVNIPGAAAYRSRCTSLNHLKGMFQPALPRVDLESAESHFHLLAFVPVLYEVQTSSAMTIRFRASLLSIGCEIAHDHSEISPEPFNQDCIRFASPSSPEKLINFRCSCRSISSRDSTQINLSLLK